MRRNGRPPRSCARRSLSAFPKSDGLSHAMRKEQDNDGRCNQPPPLDSGRGDCGRAAGQLPLSCLWTDRGRDGRHDGCLLDPHHGSLDWPRALQAPFLPGFRRCRHSPPADRYTDSCLPPGAAAPAAGMMPPTCRRVTGPSPEIHQGAPGCLR